VKLGGVKVVAGIAFAGACAAHGPADVDTQVKLGMAAYHRVCAQCHGRDAISTNAIPDLRHMTPETRAEFIDIVLQGKRLQKGMANFADMVTPAEADDINFYLIARAREDYNK
jgi:quinohemoprotein ethanol dehydrogenase